MTKIAVCDSDCSYRELLASRLAEELPAYQIVADESVRGILTALTGVDLKVVRHVSLENVLTALKSNHASFPDLGIMITGDNLIDQYAGCNDNILQGWDLAQILRATGYSGMIAYNGVNWLPTSKEQLFDGKFNKVDNNMAAIIAYARQAVEIKQQPC